jgi:hypothetical protein
LWDAVAEVGMASRMDAATSCADQFIYLSIKEVQTVFRRCGCSPMPPSHIVVTRIAPEPTGEHTQQAHCSEIKAQSIPYQQPKTYTRGVLSGGFPFAHMLISTSVDEDDSMREGM